MVQDQFAAWEAKLRGEDPPLVNGEVPSGFWRLVKSDRSMHALATWRNEKTQRKFARFNRTAPMDITDHEAEFFDDVMTRAWSLPIENDLYEAVIDGAAIWEELPPEIMTRFSNLPADRWQTIRQKLDAERALWTQWWDEVGRTIETEADATRCALWNKRLVALDEMADDYYAAVRRPIEEQLKQCREEHRPTLDAIKELRRAIKNAPLAFLEQRKHE